MFSAIAAIFGGPIVGVLGSLVSGVVGYFERKQQIEADKAKYAHEKKLLDMQHAMRGREMENERAIATMETDAQNLSASYMHDASYGQATQWVVNVLRLVRPALTVALVGIVAYMVVANTAGVEGQKIATKVLFLAEVAVTWWFADRRKAAARQ
tara:strand:+ start:1059 stop:1520 length:462 start_codon:yes stop_codon:yes gene_type:complete